MKASVKDKIIGTWKLVSWIYTDGDNQTVDFFGKDPVGILMYDTRGYMNAQLMKGEGRMLFGSPALMSGSANEIENAYKSYAAYFGKYYEKSPGKLIHIVEGSLQPNWVGEEETRYATIDGDYLTLSAPPVSINGKDVTFYVRWKRA